jgi:hypothetical protein
MRNPKIDTNSLQSEAAVDLNNLPADAFELKHNDIHAHIDTNFASQNFWLDAYKRFVKTRAR